jgi:hypothetical protein
MKPHVLECNFRGAINLPPPFLSEAGVLTLRRWLIAAANVNLLNSWPTPARLDDVCFMDEKSPVANARLMPFSIVLDFIILPMLVVLMIDL